MNSEIRPDFFINLKNALIMQSHYSENQTTVLPQENLLDWFTPSEISQELDLLFGSFVQSQAWAETPKSTKGKQVLMIRLLRNHFSKE